MNINFFIVLGLSFISFIAPAICFAGIARKGTFNQSKITDSPVVAICATLLPLSIAAYFLTYKSSDFVGSYSLLQPVVTFIGAVLIMLSGHINALKQKLWLILPLCVLGGILVMPEGGFTIVEGISPSGNKILLGIIWLTFAAIYRYANSGNGMLASQSTTIGLGIGILGVLNAVPLLLGAYGWMTAASFLALAVFSWYPSRIKISATDSVAFGYILFSLIAAVSDEGAISSCVIFALYFLLDFAFALLLKLTFLPRFGDMLVNSSIQQAVENGMNPAQAASVTLRIQILVLLFGCFQVYSPTPWSLLLITTLIAIWLLYRFRNVAMPVQSLKDINAQVLEELQDRMDEFKSYVKKDNEY